jgi:hypothetical protein
LLTLAAVLLVLPAGAGAGAGPCTAQQTRAVVVAFASAWSRGDVAAIERLVAPEPQFKWISAARPGSRFSPQAYSRASVGAYIARRAAHHDRIAIKRFQFNGSDVRDDGGYGHFEFDVIRTSDDWPTGTPHLRTGKGAIVCTLPRPVLAVWSLG